jgi:pimeloyl-ACP methyl ester carboxylesterase
MSRRDEHSAGFRIAMRAAASRREFLRNASTGALSASVLTRGFPAAAASAATATSGVFEDFVVDLGDVVLSGRALGAGDLILIHPSLGRGALDFDPLTQLLAAGGYRVASFDPRGIGQSTAPSQTLSNLTLHDYASDMLRVMRALGTSRAHVLGHAFGNRVARTLATDHPEAVRTVTLCACGGGTASAQATAGISLVTNPETPTAQFKDAVKSTFFAPKSDPTPWYVGWYDMGSDAEVAATQRTQTSEFEAGGSAPMLIIQGLEDIVAPPSIGHALKSKYGSRIELHDLDGCAHALIIEKTGAVADIILRCLGSHAPATVPSSPGLAAQRLVVRFYGRRHPQHGVLVVLNTTRATLSGLTVELRHGKQLVARGHVRDLTTAPHKLVLLPLHSSRFAAGRYTLLVRAGATTLLRRYVHIG